MPCDECAQWKDEAGKLKAALREADEDLRLGGYCRLCSKKADQGIPHGYKCPFAVLKENDRG